MFNEPENIDNLEAILSVLKILAEMKKKIESCVPVEQTAVNGFIISTANIPDIGFETAILNIKDTVPVERYKTIEEAKHGQLKWAEFIRKGQKTIRVRRLETGILKEEDVILVGDYTKFIAR